jgi:hypothetical protein
MLMGLLLCSDRKHLLSLVVWFDLVPQAFRKNVENTFGSVQVVSKARGGERIVILVLR